VAVPASLFDPKWAETAEALAVTKVKAEAPPQPTGIDPNLLDRCLRLKASTKGVDAPKSADDLVIRDQETKKLREQCVMSVVARHRQPEKTKAPK